MIPKNRTARGLLMFLQAIIIIVMFAGLVYLCTVPVKYIHRESPARKKIGMAIAMLCVEGFRKGMEESWPDLEKAFDKLDKSLDELDKTFDKIETEYSDDVDDRVENRDATTFHD